MAKKRKVKKSIDQPIYKIKWKIIIPAFLFISFAIYSNTLKTPFILDDNKLIVDNSAIQNNSIYTKFNLPRYIGYVSFGLNYKLTKYNPISYHIVNILIHFSNSILIIILLNKLFRRIEERKVFKNYHTLPIFVALLFLVHPLQTQAVTYVVQRLTSLATMFVLLSIIYYIKFKESKNKFSFYFLALIFAVFAYKTKENTATLSLMIIAIEAIFFNKKDEIIPFKKRVIYIIPFILLVVVIPLSFVDFDKFKSQNFSETLKNIENTMQNIFLEFVETTQETKLISRKQYLLTEFNVIITYIRMLFIPINQSLHHMYPLAKSLFEIPTFFSFTLLFAIVIIAIVFYKKYIEIFFGIIWFYTFLLVESSIIPIQDVIFEHRVYLPSIGFFITIIYGLFFLLGSRLYKSLPIIIISLAVILSFLTYKRNIVWKDEISIWEDVIKKYPNNHIAHGSIGTAYAKINRCDKAIPELLKSIELYPGYAKSINNLATCYLKMGKVKDAVETYKKAIEVDPNYVRAYYNLASLYYLHGNINQSLFYLLLAKEIDNNDAMVNGQLGSIYCQIGEYIKSEAYFKKALSIEPDNETIKYNYEACLRMKGQISK
jgi:tetratricopeptide (TPR) repeat protein